MLLLDTHVLLWVITGHRLLGGRARERITEDSDVWVSAASTWELTIKEMLGKITVPADFDERLRIHNFGLLDITAAHTRAIRRFPELASHDPFDRLLVAQAATDGLSLLTADRVLLATAHPFIVDATE